MKRYILTTFFLLLLSAAGQAQEYGLYLMPEVWNANYLNPGLFPRQNVVVSLPSVYGSFNVRGAGSNRLFTYDAEEDVHYINLTDLLGDLRGDLISRNDIQADALGLGMRIGQFFVSASTSTRVETSFNAPESLLRLIWEGTENQLDIPLQVGPSFDGIAYQKVSLGLSYPVLPRLSVGVRINRLLGLASFKSERSNLNLLQSSEIYQTTAEIDYQFNYYSGGQLTPIDKTVQGFENFADEIGEDDLESGNASTFRDINQQNNGWSFDFGAEYLFSDRLTFSASVLNLGSIRWKNGTQQVRVGGEATFEGIDVIELSSEEEFMVIPGFDTTGVFEATSGIAYNQALSPRTYLGATYQLSQLFEGGALLHNEFGRHGTLTALSLMGRMQLGRIFHLGANYTLQTRTGSIFGANLALKLGPVQLYAIGDNLWPVLNPRRIDGINFRAGLNLTFGRKDSEERLTALREPLTDDIAMRKIAGRTPKKKENRKPATDQKRKTAETPTVDPVIPERDEPALVTEAPPEPKVPEQKRRKKEESVPAVAPPEPKARPGIFAQEIEFRDEQSRDLLDVIYVDIYEVDAEGNRNLVRTGRHPGGKFSLQLPEDPDWYEIEVKAYQYEPMQIRFRPLLPEKLEETWYMSPADDN